MPVISKLDFQQWKDHLVTKGYFDACNLRIEDAKEILSNEAGLDPIQDSFMRGFIRAYREMLDFRLEDTTLSVEDDE